MGKLRMQVFMLALCLVAVLAAKHYVNKFVASPQVATDEAKGMATVAVPPTPGS